MYREAYTEEICRLSGRSDLNHAKNYKAFDKVDYIKQLDEKLTQGTISYIRQIENIGIPDEIKTRMQLVRSKLEEPLPGTEEPFEGSAFTKKIISRFVMEPKILPAYPALFAVNTVRSITTGSTKKSEILSSVPWKASYDQIDRERKFYQSGLDLAQDFEDWMDLWNIDHRYKPLLLPSNPHSWYPSNQSIEAKEEHTESSFQIHVPFPCQICNIRKLTIETMFCADLDLDQFSNLLQDIPKQLIKIQYESKSVREKYNEKQIQYYLFFIDLRILSFMPGPQKPIKALKAPLITRIHSKLAALKKK